MTQGDTGKVINERATEWVARIDAGPLDAAAQAEFDDWLAFGNRHRGAFFRASVAWRMLDRAGALASSATAFQAQTPFEEKPATSGAGIASTRRGILWGSGAIAASLVATVIGWKGLSPGPTRIQTAVGEIRKVSLSDTSIAMVNTATTLDIDFGRGRRDVRLEAGEAWFEVAKDKQRPFIVTTGNVHVRAVGTAFSVRRLSEGADVQVTEGQVEVWISGHEGRPLIVRAGARTRVSNFDGPQPAVTDTVAIGRRLAWREGALSFEGDTIAEAVAEFNRYNSVKLEVDPGLAQERIVGRFRIHEPATFAQAASTMLDARVHEAGRGTIRIAE